MKFFGKFFRSLNSADSSLFMVLAICFGIIGGFMPTFNILNILILFIVFIFRIPLGLYFASSSLFYVVGYFCDFLFHKIGLFVLHIGFLQGFWQTLYNTPFMRWTNFNNSITMGAFVSGIVLFVIAYFVLNKSIDLYRAKVFGVLGNISWLKWIVPLEEKKGIFRLSGVVALVLIFGFIGWSFATFTDPLLKSALVFGIEKSTNKPVFIGNLKTSFSKLCLDINDIRIGNVKIDNVYLKLDWKKLVWKKYDIKDLVISKVYLNHPLYQPTPTKETVKNVTKTNSTKIKLTQFSHIKLPKNLIDKNLQSKIKTYIKQAKNLYNKYKVYLPKKENTTKYVRGKGVWVVFRDTIKYPNLVLNRGSIDIIDPMATYKVELSNISNNPILLGKIASINITSSSKFYKKAQIKFSYKNLNKIDIDGFLEKIVLHYFKINKLILNGVADVRFDGYYQNDIYLNIVSNIKNTHLRYGLSNNLLNKVLKNVKKFNVLIKIKGKNNIKVSSNLDKIILDTSKRLLNSELKKETQKLKQKLKNKIQSKIDKTLKKKVNKDIQNKLNKLIKF